MSDPSEVNVPTPPKMAKRANNGSWRGNKYPVLKQRGYYSDVASKENIDKIGVSFF